MGRKRQRKTPPAQDWGLYKRMENPATTGVVKKDKKFPPPQGWGLYKKRSLSPAVKVVRNIAPYALRETSGKTYGDNLHLPFKKR